MRITWHAHACFRLATAGGVIVTDPYTPERAGLEPVREPADVVIISSTADRAHSNWRMINGQPEVVSALEVVGSPRKIRTGAVVHAIPNRESTDRPDDPRDNAIYVIEDQQATVCHLGDIGVMPDNEQIAFLRDFRPDVLLAVVGAIRTLPLDQLSELIDALDPRIVIPMHYKTPHISYPLLPLSHFLQTRRDPVVYQQAVSLEVDPDNFPIRRTTVVLEPELG